MAKSTLEVPDIGTVFVTKKRGQRTMRLRVDTKGQVQLSIPWIVPKAAAMSFIKSKLDWIKEQQAEVNLIPYNGMLFGKRLQLMIRNHTSGRVKIDGKYVIMPFAKVYDPNDREDRAKVESAMRKALRNEAEAILLPRLKEISDLYGFTFSSSSIKQVTGRWGSCDSKQHIVLSLYLIQLPIELIDYVIIHELAHTRHMNHSTEFWKTVQEWCPDYKILRKRMKSIRPSLYDAKTFMA